MKFLDQITEKRERIATLETEWEALERQPRSRKQVEDIVTAQIDAAARKAPESLRTLQHLAAGHAAEILTVAAPYGRVDLLPVMVHLLGVEVVKAALLADIGQIPKGLESFSRGNRLAAIESELHELQTQEENLIREAKLTGQDIPRRPNAAPAYMLALEAGQ